MGYYSTFNGKIDIDPPLPWNAVKDTLFFPEKEREYRQTYEGSWDRNYPSLTWATQSVEREIDGETFVSQRVVAIEPVEGEGSFYSFEYDLADMVALVREHGSEVSGYITRTGEEAGDVERRGVFTPGGPIESKQAKLVFD